MTVFKSITKFLTLKYARCCSSQKSESVKICLVGGGPAGFYAAQQIVKLSPNAVVDIYERLPIPFGLVRFGVAPDHLEVKNVINTFTKTAKHPNVNFYGNITLGSDVSLESLRNAYHAVILSYGAEEDRSLGIPGENLKNVIAARRFVGWYNGLPSDKDLDVDLNCDTAVVVGQGNVAVDVARILLTPVDKLKVTDITAYALERLSTSKVKRVHLVGRRGPMQVAFTIKELRELLNMPGVQTVFNKADFTGIAELIPNLGRPRKRLTELLYKAAMSSPPEADKVLEIKFKRSPLAIEGRGCVEGVQFGINSLEGESWETQKAVATSAIEETACGLLLRSIGYKSIQPDVGVPFDKKSGVVTNINGFSEPGLYCCGWVCTGPVGVILSTMTNAFSVGQLVHQHISSGQLDVSQKKPGSEAILTHVKAKGVQVVNFDGWERIDAEEERRGKAVGKPREKIVTVEEMLNIAGGS